MGSDAIVQNTEANRLEYRIDCHLAGLVGGKELESMFCCMMKAEKSLPHPRLEHT
jgi:hypothetical protein